MKKKLGFLITSVIFLTFPVQVASAQLPITLQQIISGSVVPTINPITDSFGRPIITGTYDSSDNQQLRVYVAGVWYVLGIDPELSAEGDIWELDLTSLQEPLPPGQYTAAVEVVNSIDEILINTAEFTVLERPVHIPEPVEKELSSTGHSLFIVILLALFSVIAGALLLSHRNYMKLFTFLRS